MIWNTHTNPQTHTLTHTDAVVRHTLTLKYVPGERNILPTINGRQKKKKKRGEKRKARGEETTAARKEEKTRRECSSENKTVFSLPSANGAGPRKESKPATWGLKPPVSDPPLTLLSFPLSLFFSTHLTCSTSPPPPPKKKGHPRTLFPFL